MWLLTVLVLCPIYRHFDQLIGELVSKQWSADSAAPPRKVIGDSEGLSEPAEAKEYADVALEHLFRVETLGMGGFGRVELVGVAIIVVQG